MLDGFGSVNGVVLIDNSKNLHRSCGMIGAKLVVDFRIAELNQISWPAKKRVS